MTASRFRRETDLTGSMPPLLIAAIGAHPARAGEPTIAAAQRKMAHRQPLF
jgi:hypothetical protein